MKIIDAHIHFNSGEPQDLLLLEDLDVRLLNICFADRPGGAWHQEQAEPYGRLARQCPGRYAWCTTFDLPDYPLREHDYADRVIDQLDRDFAAGAVACKVWKNIGMDLRDETGRYVMLDEPVFEPILRHLERVGKPLLGHLADPMACWRPLDPASPHYRYYSAHPQWHLYGKTEFPSHRQILAARDRVIYRHPGLSFIGAHLGSMEDDLPGLAECFERFPNFAVDLSARLCDLAWQDPIKVRAFIEHYADRILWGSDMAAGQWVGSASLEAAAISEESFAPKIHHLMRRVYHSNLTYFSDETPIEIAGRTVGGLGLSPPVFQRVFHDNARRWYPDLE